MENICDRINNYLFNQHEGMVPLATQRTPDKETYTSQKKAMKAMKKFLKANQYAAIVPATLGQPNYVPHLVNPHK